MVEARCEVGVLATGSFVPCGNSWFSSESVTRRTWATQAGRSCRGRQLAASSAWPAADQAAHCCMGRDLTRLLHSTPGPGQVTVDEIPSGGRLAAAADMLAFTGGSGYKQRSPFLMAGRIGGASQQGGGAAAATDIAAAGGRAGKRKRRGDGMDEGSDEDSEEEGGEGTRGWQARLRGFETGFYNPVRCGCR